MGLILNIETSTNVCSVSLAENGQMFSLKEDTKGQSHASLLAVFIKDILKQNRISPSEIDAVSISKGPGSYTGLRIGVSTAKGICYAVNKPLISINTLQALAYGVTNDLSYYLPDYNKKKLQKTLFCPMIDARRMEVYSAFFDIKNNFFRKTGADIIDNNSYKDILNNYNVLFFGNGAEKCKQVIKSKNAHFIDGVMPCAKNMAELSENKWKNKNFEDVAYFEPFYLKDFIATKPKKNIYY